MIALADGSGRLEGRAGCPRLGTRFPTRSVGGSAVEALVRRGYR